jgi:hypothetical protein
MNAGHFEVEIKENAYYEIRVDSDGFDLDDLKKLVNIQKSWGGKKLPVLVVCHENASADVDLLKELSKNKNDPYSRADAFVIASIAQKILANFYIKIFVPERPTKFFNNKDEALRWLHAYM